MTLVDRFICRREGHKPAVIVKNPPRMHWTSYITTCLRCGKAFEVKQEKHTSGEVNT